MTNKYHEEVKDISEILNQESYICGACNGCDNSYNQVMKVINKIIRKRKR